MDSITTERDEQPMTQYVLHGDCVDVMRGMEPDSIDAIVTDPPYGLEFMGKEWDRLDDPNVGKLRAVGFSDNDGKADAREHNEGGTWFGSRDAQSPNYYRSTNAKCPVERPPAERYRRRPLGHRAQEHAPADGVH